MTHKDFSAVEADAQPDVSGIFTDAMPLAVAPAVYAAAPARTADCVKVALTF